MTIRTELRALAALAFVVAGCTGGTGGDTDGDGLKDKDELALGLDPAKADSDDDGLNDFDEVNGDSDPLNADTDADGLNDGDEAEAGSDPNVVDTDGDGYTDRDEVFEGKDPADPNSVIYKGGWPYYYEKAEILGGNTELTIEEGKRFGRFEFRDQYGDLVNLFDFYNADKPIVIDVSAQWCPPCNGLAEYIGNEGDPYGFSEIWPAGPDVVARGDVYWITILGEDNSGAPASKVTATEWSTDHPADPIPVLADTAYLSVDYIKLNGWPTLALLNPNLMVDVYNQNYYPEVLAELNNQFPE